MSRPCYPQTKKQHKAVFCFPAPAKKAQGLCWFNVSDLNHLFLYTCQLKFYRNLWFMSEDLNQHEEFFQNSLYQFIFNIDFTM